MADFHHKVINYIMQVLLLLMVWSQMAFRGILLKMLSFYPPGIGGCVSLSGNFGEIENHKMQCQPTTGVLVFE